MSEFTYTREPDDYIYVRCGTRLVGLYHAYSQRDGVPFDDRWYVAGALADGSHRHPFIAYSKTGLGAIKAAPARIRRWARR